MFNYKVYLFAVLACIFVIGIGVILARYFRDIRAARERLNQYHSQVMKTSCGPIEYVRVGEGFPVLVTHGTFGGFDQALVSSDTLAGEGFQVIAVSRFGYLRSPVPQNPNLDRQVEAYACLLDALGIQETAVLGISGGANSAIRFAARYPERTAALILQSPAAPGKVPVAPVPKAAIDIMRSDFVYWAMLTYMRPIIQQFVGVPRSYILTPETEVELMRVLDTTLPSSTRMGGMDADFYAMPPSEFPEEISETNPYSVHKIQASTLVINALDDPLAVPENVRGMAEKIPNARLVVVKDGGHLLLGHSAEVNAEVVHFLRSEVAVLESSR